MQLSRSQNAPALDMPWYTAQLHSEHGPTPRRPEALPPSGLSAGCDQAASAGRNTDMQNTRKSRHFRMGSFSFALLIRLVRPLAYHSHRADIRYAQAIHLTLMVATIARGGWTAGTGMTYRPSRRWP
jgi:hypothetical protein